MKRGITLLALVATIAIMSILLSTVTISGIATMNNAKKMSFASEISLVQESTNTYITQHNGTFPVSDSIQLDVSLVSANSLSQFDDENIVEDKIVLYKIDYEKLGITSLKYGLNDDGEEDIYVISKDTKKVYYAKGIPVGSITYYTLTDDLQGLISYIDPDTSLLINNGVVFIPSTLNWTNESLTVQVKIPKDYFSKTVTVDGSEVSSSSSDDNYQIYDVTGISDNYDIIANYAIDETSLVINSKYEVTNVDNTPPSITLDSANQQLFKSDIPEETCAYLKILDKSDDLSGIENIKYENERILDSEIESYFKTNGKVVYKDMIQIDKNVKNITVYIEDKAGNWSASFVTVSDNVYTGLLE